MAVGKWVITNKAKEYIGDGTIDLDNAATNSFRVALLNSGFNYSIASVLSFEVMATSSVNTNLASNRSSDPYLTTLWVSSGSTTRFRATGAKDTASWTATPGTLSPAWAVLYYDVSTSPADPIIAFCDLVTGAATPLTITAGNTLQMSFPTAGLFTLGGATDPSAA